VSLMDNKNPKSPIQKEIFNLYTAINNVLERNNLSLNSVFILLNIPEKNITIKPYEGLNGNVRRELLTETISLNWNVSIFPNTA